MPAGPFSIFAKEQPSGYASRMRFFLAVACLLVGLTTSSLHAADRLDPAPRVAVISAFEPEWKVLKADVRDAKRYEVNGVEFVTGILAGRKVVLFLSGISMVNATMTTQLALDRFNIDGIVVSGIAGGVDPSLHVGDVVVAARWAQYLESVFARENDGKFELPPFAKSSLPNYGMIFPRDVEVRSAKASMPEKRLWFDADAGMLAAAGKLGAVELNRCTAEQACLDAAPRLVVGGNGVSGQAFVDNASFRTYVFETFKARVLDMETAAIATVAYANAVPFVAFRSLSDLAGGSHAGNEMATFFRLASDNSAAVVRRFLAQWTPAR